MVFSPIVHNHPIAINHELPKGWEFWKQIDLRMVRSCDAFAMLLIEGYTESKGMQAEREYAELLNKKIIRVIPEGTGQFYIQVL